MEFQSRESSGYLFSTLYYENVEIRHFDGTTIDLDKMTFNFAIIKTILNNATLDLLTAEGGKSITPKIKTADYRTRQTNAFTIPFNVKSFFVDSNIKTFINQNWYNFDVMIGAS